ncbi:MAG: endolytic transglycosylase MltG [Paracoccaceae bacterium]
MRHVAANVLTLVIAAGFALAVLIGRAVEEFRADGPHDTAVRIQVPRGATLDEVTELTGQAGLFPERSVWGLLPGQSLFRLGARYTGQATAIRFGDYEVPAGASMAETLALLTRGSNVQYRIVVPEGLTSWEVVRLLEAAPSLAGEVAEIPPEGSLAPDTYFVDRGTERAALIARMQAAQERILAEAWAARANGLPVQTPEEALILASIVEKETAIAAERPEVASVFINRLRRDMRLQTDPTVVYGAIQGQGALDRPPTGPELRQLTPWNTYRIDGLPPTPIANPGRAAIEATLNPAETEYIYFVADGTGGHAFARTLTEHNANVRAWRQFQRQRPQTQP